MFHGAVLMNIEGIILCERSQIERLCVYIYIYIYICIHTYIYILWFHLYEMSRIKENRETNHRLGVA